MMWLCKQISRCLIKDHRCFFVLKNLSLINSPSSFLFTVTVQCRVRLVTVAALCTNKRTENVYISCSFSTRPTGTPWHVELKQHERKQHTFSARAFASIPVLSSLVWLPSLLKQVFSRYPCKKRIAVETLPFRKFAV